MWLKRHLPSGNAVHAVQSELIENPICQSRMFVTHYISREILLGKASGRIQKLIVKTFLSMRPEEAIITQWSGCRELGREQKL